MKLLFATGPSLNTRLLVAVLLSVALLVVDQRSTGLHSLRSALSLLVYPVQLLVSLPVDMAEYVNDTFVSYRTLQTENSELKERQLVNDAKLLKLAALEKENIRLRALLENSFKLGEQVLVAELLSVNLAPYEHIVVVNKGSRFGVYSKQPVLDAQGVVGQVVRTLPASSEIMLITDPNHAIPVQVNRNGLRTIAIGSGRINQLKLPFLPNNADILPGDLLVTSGLGGTFPQGYPVAVVDEFKVRPNKPFASISATPKAELDKSREFLIVWSDATPVPLTDKQMESSQEPGDATE
ncbi:rod shape-determining protein MreC [Methylomarinum sp. Ch1-1]|uniref:Cell shape-determining protein MreC n=1 Tax=Methylomarinum roseum TaxID=3067653 RepID=A0AAU7NZT7_9GAMM|nr:rod shape-determining protein MreC [Methylomarinum sp. Ch1-1]MDP4519020.1 rod shape-determining protein MreC [Methylomarinum sp. Ch1-1]